MCDFNNYIDTKLEIDLNKTRLNLLLEQKDEIYNKYFPTTAKIKDVVVSKTNKQKDNYAEYVNELQKINKINNMTLDEEILYLKNNISRLERHLALMEEMLSSVEGLQYELFTLIACKGVNPTAAVQKLADREPFYYSERNIWRTYNKKIKKYVEKLKICQ